MNIRHFTLGIGMVLLLAGVSNSDETKTKHVSCTFGATFVSGVETHLDTNGDMRSASVHQGLVNCNSGRFLFQEAAEFQNPLSAPVSCPAGTLEFRLQQEHGVNTEERSGDQLFYEVATNEETLCLNPADFSFSFTAQGTITGGTGQFAGASGSFESQATGKYLVTGEKEGVFGGFGQFSGTSTGTLIIQK
jgi:hypothetical protein